MVVIFLIFGGTFLLYPIVAAPVMFPSIVCKSSLFFSSSLKLISCLFDSSHYDKYEVMSHCGADVHFPGEE